MSTIAPYPTPAGSGLGDFGNRPDIIGGKRYSVGSAWSGEKTHAFVYDPAANTWSPIAASPVPRDNAAVVADNGKLYVSGGFASSGAGVAETAVYDPATDTWTKLAPNPAPTSSMGVAVANGVIYLVGGCQNASNCRGAAAVETYDPQTGSWAPVAPYPHPDSWLSCGGINGKVYCAGGINSSTTYTDGYVYNPLTDSWSPIASLPIDLWGSVAGAANGMLVISGGATNQSSTITKPGYAYDTNTDTWSPIPNAQFPSYRAAGACGFYKIGGITPPQVFEPSERVVRPDTVRDHRCPVDVGEPDDRHAATTAKRPDDGNAVGHIDRRRHAAGHLHRTDRLRAGHAVRRVPGEADDDRHRPPHAGKIAGWLSGCPLTAHRAIEETRFDGQVTEG